jgi:putative peptide zinc metalloprotease protein
VVSAVTQAVSAGPAAPAADADAGVAGAVPVLADPPRLAEGTELMGEFRDSGDSQPPSLVRRPDGQVIQMSKLLYLTAAALDGTRDDAAVAAVVSAGLGKTLTAEQARYLITAKLLPLGVLAVTGTPAAGPAASQLLTVKARGTLLPGRAAAAAGTALRPLFRPPVIAAVAAVTAALDWWIFAVHGLGAGLGQALRDPASLLTVFALFVASAAFHELGHAAGCRYGGARPGRIGAGIYLLWPSFFTNVTDSYRLSRAGRLRTDLGGLYFNLLSILALAGAYAGTGSEILLLAIAAIHLQMLEQLLPFARFDGYWILSDLIGVPDLFDRVAPIVKNTLTRGRHPDPRITGMRPAARAAVTAWVLTLLPVLTATAGYLLLRLPAIDRALWHATTAQARATATAATAGHYPAAATAAISLTLAAITAAGTLYLLTALLRRAAVAALRTTTAHPARGLAAITAAAATATALALYWTTQGQFHGW